MRTRTRTLGILLAALCLGAPGCESKDPIGRATIALTKAGSCADLEALLKQDALLQMNAVIDAQIRAYDSRDRGFSLFGGVAADEAGADYGSGGAGGAGTGGSTTGGDGSGPPAHSETNTQVEGVDEADIVKTDGNYIYLVHGAGFFILDAWPTSDLSVGSSLPIEGQPLEMYVAGDKAVVYSLVPAAPVLGQAGVAPRPRFCGAYSCSSGWAEAGMPSDYMGEPVLTKVTILALAGAQASVLKEHYFEGSYTSSRRVGSHVRTVLSGGFGPAGVSYYPDMGWDYSDDYVGALEAQREINTSIINASRLSDWLPRGFARAGGGIEALPMGCEDYYVPTAGTTAYGLTQVLAIDLNALDAPPAHTSIVGATQTIYSNTETMVLAAPSWDDPWLFETPEAPISTTLTHLHEFDVATDPAHPKLVASGSVPGTLNNQFSLDAKDGFVRMSTSDTIVSPDAMEASNAVFVVGKSNGRLVTVGELRGLAPGETIYATRFVGDRGYVVTFRQMDPLFVVDLSTPTSPKLMASLEIPGFSEYMHPIDDNHLLTIGKGGDQFGATDALALQIFDVTNGASPVLAHKYVFPGYGASEAEENHKAFTYYPTLGMLAFPYQGYAGDWRSTLELFRVDVTTGITRAGTIDHTKFFNGPDGYCGGYYDGGVRRGLFIEDYVYSISYGGVLVNAVSDLSQVASLALPAPTYDGCYSY